RGGRGRFSSRRARKAHAPNRWPRRRRAERQSAGLEDRRSRWKPEPFESPVRRPTRHARPPRNPFGEIVGSSFPAMQLAGTKLEMQSPSQSWYNLLPVYLIVSVGVGALIFRLLTCPARLHTICSSASRSLGVPMKLALGFPASLLMRTSVNMGIAPR